MRKCCFELFFSEQNGHCLFINILSANQHTDKVIKFPTGSHFLMSKTQDTINLEIYLWRFVNFPRACKVHTLSNYYYMETFANHK